MSRAYAEVHNIEYSAYKEVKDYSIYSVVYCFENRHVKYIRKTGYKGKIINLEIRDIYTYEQALNLFKLKKIFIF